MVWAHGNWCRFPNCCSTSTCSIKVIYKATPSLTSPSPNTYLPRVGAAKRVQVRIQGSLAQGPISRDALFNYLGATQPFSLFLGASESVKARVRYRPACLSHPKAGCSATNRSFKGGKRLFKKAWPALKRARPGPR